MTNFLRDHEAILSRFSDWLTQTNDEIESLAVFTDSEDSDELTDELTAERLQNHSRSPVAGTAQISGGGQLQLAEAFTALRHEIKLHTRGTRNLEAVVEQSMNGLESASREFRSVQAKEREAAERAARPVVEALIGLDEGLLRAAKAFQLTCDRITRLMPTRIQESLDQACTALPVWRRLLNRRWFAQLRTMAAGSARQATVTDFASLMQGFEQIQLRLSRALQDLGIVRLNECGGLVDPAQMTVIEIIESDTLPAETVLEVVRPGYTYGGRVIRFAEVRATVGVRLTPVLPADVTHSDGRRTNIPHSPFHVKFLDLIRRLLRIRKKVDPARVENRADIDI